MGPRLRESRLLAPSGRGEGCVFTQPRAHLLADPCIASIAICLNKCGSETNSVTRCIVHDRAKEIRNKVEERTRKCSNFQFIFVMVHRR